jgi:hypothetical protein
MYCPNCNAELPEGTSFCGCCGAKLTQPETQTYTAPAAPAYPNYSAYTSYTSNNMTKKEFLASDAGLHARGQAKLAVLVCLIAVAVIIAGIFATLTMPIFDIPVMSIALEAADADPDDLLDELENELDAMEEEYEMIEDDFSKSEREDIESWMEAAGDMADNFSILNLQKFVKDTAVIVDEHGDEFDTSDLDDIAEGMDAINQAMGAVIVFVVGFFFLPILFAVLGGTLKNTTLTVVGIVFTAIAQVIFCGMLWVVLSLVVGVVQAVLCSKVNTAYRDYRLGKLPA